MRAHDIQAQTIEGRLRRTERAWARLDEVAAAHRLPERTVDVLYDALIGFRVRRHGYLSRAQVDERTASRDLKTLNNIGLLEPRGETGARHCIAGEKLRAIRASLREEVPRRIVDPYPQLRSTLYQPEVGSAPWRRSPEL